MTLEMKSALEFEAGILDDVRDEVGDGGGAEGVESLAVAVVSAVVLRRAVCVVVGPPHGAHQSEQHVDELPRYAVIEWLLRDLANGPQSARVSVQPEPSDVVFELREEVFRGQRGVHAPRDARRGGGRRQVDDEGLLDRHRRYGVPHPRHRYREQERGLERRGCGELDEPPLSGLDHLAVEGDVVQPLGSPGHPVHRGVEAAWDLGSPRQQHLQQQQGQ